jgi:aspartyl-tRNA(Asn)/glutamyl-tRNA(Gln) amidotransferase subunit C
MYGGRNKVISREEVGKIARLANLDLTEVEIETMRENLDRILGFVEELNALDIPDIPVDFFSGKKKLFMREDEAVIFPADDLLEQAPKRKKRFYEVPKIINEDDSSEI